MTYAGLTAADKGALLKAKECGGSTYSRWATIGDKWVRELTVNIDLALAQIAEMESADKPLTWNERINQMTVEEKAKLLIVESSIVRNIGSGEKTYPVWITPLIDGVSFTSKEAAINYNKDHLNSPYTEGETK